MLATSIGYPVGFYENKYQIELDGNLKNLLPELGAAWMLLNSIKVFNENDPDMWNLICALERSGLLVKGNTSDEIMKQLFSYKPMRQGTGATYENEKTIFFGKYRMTLNAIEFDMWKLSNYRRTLKDIHHLIKSKHNCSDDVFAESFAHLYEKSLIFIA